MREDEGVEEAVRGEFTEVGGDIFELQLASRLLTNGGAGDGVVGRGGMGDVDRLGVAMGVAEDGEGSGDIDVLGGVAEGTEIGVTIGVVEGDEIGVTIGVAEGDEIGVTMGVAEGGQGNVTCFGTSASGWTM